MLRNLNLSNNGKRDSSDGRVGVLASEIPLGGAMPAWLLNDIDAAAPGRFYSLEVLTLPSAGTLYLDKRSVGTFSGAPDGTYTGSQRIDKYDPGVGLVSSATSTYSLQVGSGATIPNSPTKTANIILGNAAGAIANRSGLAVHVFTTPNMGLANVTDATGKLVLDLTALGVADDVFVAVVDPTTGEHWAGKVTVQ